MNEIFDKLEDAIDSLIESKNGGITDTQVNQIIDDLFFIRNELSSIRDNQKAENEHRDSFK